MVYSFYSRPCLKTHSFLNLPFLFLHYSLFKEAFLVLTWPFAYLLFTPQVFIIILFSKYPLPAKKVVPFFLFYLPFALTSVNHSQIAWPFQFSPFSPLFQFFSPPGL